MKRHADFLGALYVVWGALTVLIGLATLALGVGAAALGSSTPVALRGGAVAAALAAGMFTVLAVLSLAWGATHIVCGLALRRRRHWARPVCLGLAGVNLILLPYGTALGAYGLWVLLNDEVRQHFDPVHS
ncbi:MAG TPA: hypothetical protein VND92_11755 [Vicinamibacterales bacterium]|nr:hypothetical protein [Vicinamibacterales bacterium]